MSTYDSIINLDIDYKNPDISLFLGPKRGLTDTINNAHPKLTVLLETLTSMDWGPNEFRFGRCKHELDIAPKKEYRSMITTLAWQWESDSAATNSLLEITSPFISSSALWSLYGRIGDNENIHARTYSEIVKQVFDNAIDAFKAVLDDKNAIARLECVARAFSICLNAANALRTGVLNRNDDQAYDAILFFIFVLFGLERIQFIPSFAVTFSYGTKGKYMPIANAVKKIAADEFLIHVQVGKYIIENELSTARGRAAFARISDRVSELYREIRASEMIWIDYLLDGDKDINGMTRSDMQGLVNHACTDVYASVKPYGFKSFAPVVKSCGISFMPNWLDLNSVESAPQETRDGNYLTSGYVYDDDNVNLPTKGLYA